MIRRMEERDIPEVAELERICFSECWSARILESGIHSPYDVLTENGTGCIAYSPLAQGALTDRYLHGIPADSRASRQGTTVGKRYMHEDQLAKVAKLNELAKERGQSLAQMALAWVLRRDEVASVLIGASRVSQLEDNVAALEHLDFDEEELTTIDTILGKDPGHMIR